MAFLQRPGRNAQLGLHHRVILAQRDHTPPGDCYGQVWPSQAAAARQVGVLGSPGGLRGELMCYLRQVGAVWVLCLSRGPCSLRSCMRDGAGRYWPRIWHWSSSGMITASTGSCSIWEGPGTPCPHFSSVPAGQMEPGGRAESL